VELICFSLVTTTDSALAHSRPTAIPTETRLFGMTASPSPAPRWVRSRSASSKPCDLGELLAWT